MSRLNRILRYLSLWFRPPQIASLNTDALDYTALSFVSPVFVLSTGRCGTKWLSELLRHDPLIRVNHSDYPELIRHSRLAYEQYEQAPRVFQEIIRATRDPYILDTYNRSQTYVETNNRITFFAYAIQVVYPNARYIHLVRHPGDFVRSGLRREWYHGGRHDIGRIRHQDAGTWQAMIDIEKIAWLWNETNQYIEDFLSTLEAEQFLRVKAEEMWSDFWVSSNICKFAGAEIGSKDIASMLKRKVNQQLTGGVPPYERWSAENKEQVQHYASRYGYNL